MAQDNAKCIKNMIVCRAGEHCLFRSYGLGGCVDSPQGIPAGILRREVSRWYPGLRVRGVVVKHADGAGNFTYGVDLEG